MARKSRKIYDNDATVVEQTIGVSDSVSVQKHANPVASPAISGHELRTEDVFDAFAGYLTPRLEVYEAPAPADEEHKCLICGGWTNRRIRTICFDCMSKHLNTLYTGMKSAINSGDKTIQF